MTYNYTVTGVLPDENAEVMISSEKEIKVNDIIRVDNQEYYVTEVDGRSVEVVDVAIVQVQRIS
jgi:uncharacterized Zn finger protein